MFLVQGVACCQFSEKQAVIPQTFGPVRILPYVFGISVEIPLVKAVSSEVYVTALGRELMP